MKMPYVLIGHPLEFSYSPVIHQTWFKHYGIEAEYRLEPIEKHQLVGWLNSAKERCIQGFNITAPYKTSLLDQVKLDEIQYFKSINTVTATQKGYKAISTDGLGWARSCQFHFGIQEFKGLNLVFLGFGGTVKSILNHLIHLGKNHGHKIKCHVLTRQTADPLVNNNIADVNFYSWDQQEKVLGISDILIQATSLKWSYQDTQIILSQLPKNSKIFDVNYGIKEPLFVQTSKKMGFDACSGLSMLLFQAQESFYYWTGIYPDIDSNLKSSIGLISQENMSV